ncbi:hypothetical protein KIN20_016697 [Parelaphostrongylus tenuis]|uniref:Methyltransferase FkbM domain-containing protein n=1 Tax=Parelaphostrongylus tenuis TaxID=148309 RepID=A0AAD5MHQ1_PARTN|nr:hypothetical protein KIN20_016697 [Parelaphostrongylus tenuis]
MRVLIREYVLLVLLIGSMTYYALIPLLYENNTEQSAVAAAFRDWKKCILMHADDIKTDPEKVWENFAAITTRCVNSTNVSKIKVDIFHNREEPKYFILNRTDTKPAVILTIGVGADIDAEEKLKEVLPKGTEFFGADPIRVPNAELFSKVGKFFSLAVGGYSGLYEASVRNESSLYEPLLVNHVDVLTFILKMVKHNFIDHIILDNEGPEYDIIPMMAVDNLFADSNVVVCHLNVEFHQPGPKKRLPRFLKIMFDMLRVGRYGIVRSVNIGYQQMFLVNYEDPRCVEKYLKQFFY